MWAASLKQTLQHSCLTPHSEQAGLAQCQAQAAGAGLLHAMPFGTPNIISPLQGAPASAAFQQCEQQQQSSRSSKQQHCSWWWGASLQSCLPPYQLSEGMSHALHAEPEHVSGHRCLLAISRPWLGEMQGSAHA
jgi:hypothetical protein